MSPLEAMVKAIAKEDWGPNRAGGEWSEELWDRLTKGYRELQASDEMDFIKDGHYLHGVYRKARAALLALAEVELPGNARACSLGFSSVTKREMFESRMDLRPMIFRAICRAIAEEGTGG